ncbi:hypothetical protein AB0M50_00410 [Nonomuraea fuscirosea]|uniref:hypothetical protein n=1 Tax=Nonomuraea fuscirosea TaxID=1291556 RepID=UPI002DDC854F|nr:hypothetical protein [Nonomuraea fuscirosea]WSA52215.1 hypothetical protein OIE67_50685 [Nonomuraea fuscirosea]
MTVTAADHLESVRGRVERFTRTSDRQDLCDAAGLRDAAAFEDLEDALATMREVAERTLPWAC